MYIEKNMVRKLKKTFILDAINRDSSLPTTNMYIQPELMGRFLNLNKMKTKRLSNHMSQYFIHNRT